MSIELISATIPPVTAGTILAIILYMKRERENCIRRIEKRLDEIAAYILTREKMERELEQRLSRLEGRTIERDTTRRQQRSTDN